MVATALYPSLQFRLEPDGIVGAAEGEMRIVPSGDGRLSYSGKSYAGTFTVRFDEEGKFIVINVLPIETYLLILLLMLAEYWKTQLVNQLLACNLQPIDNQFYVMQLIRQKKHGHQGKTRSATYGA